jgi:NAD(P)-dependent dehydrogenase (short-subunit alcohol dehydrogenase family)
MGNYEGKTVVITGGSTGVGLATAQLLIAEGARVLITARTQAALDHAEARLGRNLVAVRSDAASLADIDELAARIGIEFGQVDLLFVNAGVTRFVSLADMTEAVWDELFAINAKGPYFTVQKLAPLMPDGSAVVLTTSVADVKGLAMSSAYAATKAAVRSMARSFARELQPRGVRVNAVSPGPIDTGILERALPRAAAAATREQMTANNPMQRFGDPLEVARAVCFWASTPRTPLVPNSPSTAARPSSERRSGRGDGQSAAPSLARRESPEVGAGVEGVRRARHRFDGEPGASPRSRRGVDGADLQPPVAVIPADDSAEPVRAGERSGAFSRVTESMVEHDAGEPPRRLKVERGPVDLDCPARQQPLRFDVDHGRHRHGQRPVVHVAIDDTGYEVRMDRRTERGSDAATIDRVEIDVQAVRTQGVADGDDDRERVARLRPHRGFQPDRILGAGHDVPFGPYQQPVQGAPTFDLVDRQLVDGAVEAVPAIPNAVGPRRQDGAAERRHRNRSGVDRPGRIQDQGPTVIGQAGQRTTDE